jgi:membrane associated rhomboid family serine protease
MEKQKNPDFIALYLCAFLFFVYSLQALFGLELAYRPGVEHYRFLTSIFAHSGIDHLTNNMFFIGLFGTVYEMYTDTETFLATFLVSALLANLTAFIFYPDTFILGASAGAMGLLAALAVYKPNQVGLGLGVPMPMWAVLIAYIFIDIVGIGGANSVANEAHLAGVLVGGLAGYYLRDDDRREENEEDNLGFENWEERIRKWEDKWMK